MPGKPDYHDGSEGEGCGNAQFLSITKGKDWSRASTSFHYQRGFENRAARRASGYTTSLSDSKAQVTRAIALGGLMAESCWEERAPSRC